MSSKRRPHEDGICFRLSASDDYTRLLIYEHALQRIAAMRGVPEWLRAEDPAEIAREVLEAEA